MNPGSSSILMAYPLRWSIPWHCAPPFLFLQASCHAVPLCHDVQPHLSSQCLFRSSGICHPAPRWQARDSWLEVDLHYCPFTPLFVAWLLTPTPSPRRGLSLAPLALLFSISFPLHPETSKFSLRKRKKHIAEILPMIGVVTPTPMANIKRNSVGAKSPAHS